MPTGTLSKPAHGISHNLLGQRLGRKGRETRASIIDAAQRLIASPDNPQLSLSAVAREASLGMTTLYLYFNDLTELLLAVLEPIMESAEEAYRGHMRTRWPDVELGEHCTRFINEFYGFWKTHARILHMRNYQAINADHRLAKERLDAARPIIDLLLFQMDGDPADGMASPVNGLATVLVTGTERLVTVATDTANFEMMAGDAPVESNVNRLLNAQARVLELVIAEGREIIARHHSGEMAI